MKKNVRVFNFVTTVMLLLFLLSGCGNNSNGEGGESDGDTDTVMLYSSLKEDQLDALKKGFEAEYPDIKMDYYQAGTGKIGTKVATEAEAGQIGADLLWVGDPTNYIRFKEQGFLEQYESPEAEVIDDEFKDSENYYTGARFAIMGFSTSTVSVEENEVPETWDDLLDERFKDQIVLTDPGEAGTTFYMVATLMNHPDYGIEYFEKLAANGAELESGSTSTVTKVAANAYKVGIGVDYITHSLANKGSNVRFEYPKENLVAIASPIALVKDSPNPDNGKLLYDYLLSEDGQKILAETDTTPIHPDVIKEGDITLEEIVSRIISVDDSIISEQDTEILDAFDEIFK